MEKLRKRVWKRDKHKGTEVYQALFNYEASSADDLNFCQGDELEVLGSPSSGEAWWLAQNKTTGKAGYVPSNFIKKKGKEKTGILTRITNPTSTTTTTNPNLNPTTTTNPILSMNAAIYSPSPNAPTTADSASQFTPITPSATPSHHTPIIPSTTPFHRTPITPSITPSHRTPITPSTIPSHHTPITPSTIPSHHTPITPRTIPSHHTPITPSITPSHRTPITPSTIPFHRTPITPSTTPSHHTPITPSITPSHRTPITSSITPSHRTPIIPTRSNPGKQYVAMYDFATQDSDGVSFRRGDRVVVEEGVEGTGGGGLWWWGRVIPQGKNTSSGRRHHHQEGYVPSNYFAPEDDFRVQTWYFGGITRQEGEAFLLSPLNTTGAFLIRDAETSAGYSLSVLMGTNVKHYRVKEGTLGVGVSAKHYSVKDGSLFSNLGELVRHYQGHDGICVRLTHPCKTSENPRDEEEGVGVQQEERGVERGQQEGEGSLPEWEIDRNNITLGPRLGMGNYGEVLQGTWAGTTPVAVKSMKEGCMEVDEFLREAEVMRRLRHRRLVKLYGVCSRPHGYPLLIVTELVRHGALLQYLKHRKKEKLPHPHVDLVQMGAQVASGMAYLEEQQFVHRDLAARNVLMGDNLQVKIADFGLARVIKEGIYQQRSEGHVPIKWTAPEALVTHVFTTKSDVWSYGILLYEIFTHGDTPYPDLSNTETRIRVSASYRMPQPHSCPNQVYSVMFRCWMENPVARPRFKDIKEEMEDMVRLFV